MALSVCQCDNACDRMCERLRKCLCLKVFVNEDVSSLFGVCVIQKEKERTFLRKGCSNLARAKEREERMKMPSLRILERVRERERSVHRRRLHRQQQHFGPLKMLLRRRRRRRRCAPLQHPEDQKKKISCFWVSLPDVPKCAAAAKTHTLRTVSRNQNNSKITFSPA